MEAVEHLAPLYDIVASSPSSGDLSVNTTTTGSSLGETIHQQKNGNNFTSKCLLNSNHIFEFIFCYLASSTSSRKQPPFAHAKVVLCVDLSGRLENFQSSSSASALPLAQSSSLASISRANSGSSSTLSSLGSALSGAAIGAKMARRELTIGHLPLPIAPGIGWPEMDQQLGLLLEDYLRNIKHQIMA
jgi:hypothetical protein